MSDFAVSLLVNFACFGAGYLLCHLGVTSVVTSIHNDVAYLKGLFNKSTVNTPPPTVLPPTNINNAPTS